jgi:hypothetical protein
LKSALHNWFVKHNIKVNAALISAFLLLILGMNAYVFSKYTPGQTSVDRITFSSNLTANELLVYVSRDNGSSIDFTYPFSPQVVDGKFVFDLSGNTIRNFRIYIASKADSVRINNIEWSHAGIKEPLSLNRFKTDKLNKKREGLFSSEINSYLELKRSVITVPELIKTEALILVLCALFCILSVYIFNQYLVAYFKPFDLRVAGVCIYILSVFLPLPYFNIAFILSFAIIVKDFNYKSFLSNKVSLLFLLYFLWFMINNAVVSKEFNSKLMETMLPFFFFPFYVACLPKGKFLTVFPVSAFIFSLCFFTGSLIDFCIYRNINYFSFDAFTKYLHPVYFSYLLLFSLIYMEVQKDCVFNKRLFIPVFAIAMLCCGSKLIILLTVLFFASRFFRKKAWLGYAFLAIICCAVLLFSPTRKRFQEVINMNSLSILKENPIASKQDPRLTGLTLRLIIWQESLATFTGFKDILLGQGVDQAAGKLLEDRLASRQVEAGHIRYDPHNQYITTFYKLGLLGLSCLVLICFYSLKLSVSKHKILLTFTILLFIIVMFTESVLQRATGIYFFLTIILLQTGTFTINPSYFENSDSGDKGNS